MKITLHVSDETPVRKKKPNAWGVHETHGNVWEWTSSPWRRSYAADAETNPLQRVFRGGSWYMSARHGRAAVRNFYSPGVRGGIYGFRLARTSPLTLDPLTPFADRLPSGAPGPEMISLPPGRYLMGSPEDEPDRFDDEGPQHEETVGAFALGRNPVTFEEYDRFCEATGREKPDDKGWGRDRRPVINVSAHDAEAYCAWLSAETGAEYRLPTEVEWEYACRAGTTTAFHWGDDPAKAIDYAHFESDKTYPVAEQLPLSDLTLIGEPEPDDRISAVLIGDEITDASGNVRPALEADFDYSEGEQ